MAFDPSSMARQVSRSASVTDLLTTKLELDLSLRNVPKLDLLSPSDPFIRVTISTDSGEKSTFNTEIVWDNPNPNFAKQISLTYKFEEVQTVRLDVYDADVEEIGTDMSKHDYIGWASFILGDCVTAAGQKLALRLKDKSGVGLTNKKAPVVAIARVTELNTNRDEFNVSFGLSGISVSRWFGEYKPFLEIYRKKGDDWSLMHRTQVCRTKVRGSIPFRIEPLTLSVARLCNGEVDTAILLRCFDFHKDREPVFIGESETTLAGLMDSKAKLDMLNKSGKKKAKKGAVLHVLKQQLVEKHSFYEFIAGGLDINLIIAIDFTGSNGDPTSKDSLHFMGPPSYESDYLRVIKSVGRILETYDNDGMIPVYGFGANLDPPRRQISHCFPLTFASDPEVRGIDGVIEVYQNTLRRVQLYGPTYFAEIIETASMMSLPKEEHSWTILLIITDGIINDMQATTDRIVAASKNSALSIIIVGVGKGDASKGFQAMDVLDADDEPLKATDGSLMAADIVQFVEFNEFKDKHIGALAKEVLEEVPGQCEDFMARNGRVPEPPKHDRQPTGDRLYDGPSGMVGAGMAPAMAASSFAAASAAPAHDPIAAATAASHAHPHPYGGAGPYGGGMPGYAGYGAPAAGMAPALGGALYAPGYYAPSAGVAPMGAGGVGGPPMASGAEGSGAAPAAYGGPSHAHQAFNPYY